MKPKNKGKSARPYHHGSLPIALLDAAEQMLEAEGMPALTLRAVARAVGVSHTAPKNHFGDLSGLLSDLAAVGYQRFAKALRQARERQVENLRQPNLEVGRAYVKFAQAHPGLFTLMFRSERLDSNRPNLQNAIEEARQALRQMARPSAKDASPLQMAAAGVARWSLVHGFAVLLLEGRLNATLHSLPGENDADTLLDSVLRATVVTEDPSEAIKT